MFWKLSGNILIKYSNSYINQWKRNNEGKDGFCLSLEKCTLHAIAKTKANKKYFIINF